MTRLEQFYRDTVAKSLQEQFSYKSSMEVPRITKITLGYRARGRRPVVDCRAEAGCHGGQARNRGFQDP
jgi:hypothetical protein